MNRKIIAKRPTRLVGATKLTTSLTIKFRRSFSPRQGTFVVSFVVNPAERDRRFRPTPRQSLRQSLEEYPPGLSRSLRRGSVRVCRRRFVRISPNNEQLP